MPSHDRKDYEEIRLHTYTYMQICPWVMVWTGCRVALASGDSQHLLYLEQGFPSLHSMGLEMRWQHRFKLEVGRGFVCLKIRKRSQGPGVV